ncbi:hypothetical protein BC936DRAFT_146575 [Jimgerdemannia flammicorona]|uniref:Uncharacterized protein n=1 Tax=Jimgerdemannia flammicorona TaxID=994334 RepID=A0A433D7C0_9FUNG|nr:hypothetical protein BC936DRAFT_146575 [Jimgerdemannia flammicorona]
MRASSSSEIQITRTFGARLWWNQWQRSSSVTSTEILPPNSLLSSTATNSGSKAPSPATAPVAASRSNFSSSPPRTLVQWLTTTLNSRCLCIELPDVDAGASGPMTSNAAGAVAAGASGALVAAEAHARDEWAELLRRG